MPIDQATAHRAAPAPVVDPGSSFDRAGVLARVVKEISTCSLQHELGTMFEGEARRIVAEIARRAGRKRRQRGLQRLAHTMKGCASSLGGTEVASAAG